MLRLPDPEPPPQPPQGEPPRRRERTAQARDAEVADAARNPLFRAIDGGRVDAGPEERPRPRRGSARRAHLSVSPDQSPGAPPARARARAAESDGADTGTERMRPECYGCPVGIAFGTVANASPDTLDHLFAASREMVAAARSVIEALEANLERRVPRGQAKRIPLT